MDETFFGELSTREFELSSGLRMSLPRRYYDWSGIIANFLLPAAAVRTLLPTTRLKPVQLIPGTAIISFVAIEHRRIADVPACNEFAIMTPVLYEPAFDMPMLPLLFPRWFKRLGFYVHLMPVTTEVGRDLGVEIWGYPKILAEISFEETNDRRRCNISADGRDILSLEVKKMATQTKAVDYHCYTVKDGRLLRTCIQAEGQLGIARFRGGASYSLGDHPIARELRSLEIGRTAIERIYIPQAHSIHHELSERLPLN